MSKKSRAEIELDEMTEQRDHWHKVAQQVAAENGELRRHLELASDVGLALTDPGGIAHKYLRERDQVREERDQARSDLDALHGNRNELIFEIENFLFCAQTVLDQRSADLKRSMELMAKAGLTNSQPEMVTVLSLITDQAERPTVEAHNELTQKLINIRNSAEQRPLAELCRILLALGGTCRELAGIRGWRGAIMASAYSLSSDPAILCDEICQALDEPGHDVDERVQKVVRLLRRVGIRWIKSNLPDQPPSNYETLALALVWDYRYKLAKASGEYTNRKKFGQEYGVDDRYLDSARRWYKAIEANSRRVLSAPRTEDEASS